jgi:hypothetical protein
MSDEITVEWPELTVRRTRVASEFGPGPVRYGLPCANCSLYYSAELTACPICKCRERVSPRVWEWRAERLWARPRRDSLWKAELGGKQMAPGLSPTAAE